MMTQEEYLEHCGFQCPACGSDQIEAGAGMYASNFMIRGIACGACGAHWNDIYQLTRFTNLMDKDGKEMKIP